MNWFTSFRAKLLVSYLVLGALVTATVFLLVQRLTPTFFERTLQARLGPQGSGGGRGAGPGGPPETVSTSVVSEAPAEIRAAYDDALATALLVAGLVALVAAVFLAFFFSRRLLFRIREIQCGTRRIADGDYGRPVRIPPESELADLASSVNSLASELAGVEASRARLLSDLAHEIRNPLMTIEGYMEGLIDGVLPAEADTYAEVGDEAHRLRRLTEDMSLLARSQEGALTYEMVPLDLADIGRQVAERLRPQYDAAEVNLAAEFVERQAAQQPADRSDPRVAPRLECRAIDLVEVGNLVELLVGALVHRAELEELEATAVEAAADLRVKDRAA